MQFLKEEIIVGEGFKDLIMRKEKNAFNNITLADTDIISTEIKSYIYDDEYELSKLSKFVISFIKLIERRDDVELFKAGLKLLSKLLQNSINSFEDIKVLKESIEEVFKKDNFNLNSYNRKILDDVNENIRKIMVDDCIDLFFKNTLLDDSIEFYSTGMPPVPPVDPWNPKQQPDITKKGDKYYANNTSGKSFNI